MQRLPKEEDHQLAWSRSITTRLYSSFAAWISRLRGLEKASKGVENARNVAEIEVLPLILHLGGSESGCVPRGARIRRRRITSPCSAAKPFRSLWR